MPTINRSFTDTKRERVIPVRIYYSESDQALPVVLFSHGLGGSREDNAYLGDYLATRGYVVVCMQHIGSDEAIWKEAERKDRFKALKSAASAKNAKLRTADVSAVIDQLEIWNVSVASALYSKLDLTKIGMSGHSFGAVTTQAVSGQQALMGMFDTTDPRIDAAIAYSPSSPHFSNTKRAFDSVQIPWLLMTGTKDLSMIGNADMDSRLAVFPALPEGDKYELVLHDAQHSAFSDRPLWGDQASRNPNHHQAILALSAAFWDSYLKDDAGAKEWLQSDAVRSVLENKDRWQTK
jgi:predicted dienelactone hydrolase